MTASGFTASQPSPEKILCILASMKHCPMRDLEPVPCYPPQVSTKETLFLVLGIEGNDGDPMPIGNSNQFRSIQE